jgi:hypothetical protein
MVLFLVWWGHWKGGLGVGGPSGVSTPKSMCLPIKKYNRLLILWSKCATAPLNNKYLQFCLATAPPFAGTPWTGAIGAGGAGAGAGGAGEGAGGDGAGGSGSAGKVSRKFLTTHRSHSSKSLISATALQPPPSEKKMY